VQLELYQFVFPGWQASVDGEPVEVRASDPYGFTLIDVPAGPPVSLFTARC